MRLATGAELIERERQRQVQDEQWSRDHDDNHVHHELVLAAVQYALPDSHRAVMSESEALLRNMKPGVPINWPWTDESWKPSPEDRRRELVKAGALIAAEIDRLTRKAGGHLE